MSTSLATSPSKPLDLSVVLTSMDAVDRERTRESILNEAIYVDRTKVALAERLRSHYASQGITDVSPEAIERGVEQLYADRFAHKALPNGLTRTLGMAWIRRKLIGTWLVVCLIGAVLIGVTVSQVVAYGVRAEKAAVVKAEQARAAAIEAEAKRVAAEKRAAEQRAAQLKAFPERLTALGRAIGEVAKEQATKERATQMVATGVGLAAAGDLPGVQRTYQDLADTLALLNLEYEVRVNLSGAKPGMSKPSNGSAPWVTGGFRTFNGSKRHYVVVNAVERGTGKPVSVPVRSEETGQITRVSFWAEQVSEAAFNAIRAEKQRTGALRDTLFAFKGKGHLEPTYRMGLKAGDASDPAAYRITRW